MLAAAADKGVFDLCEIIEVIQKLYFIMRFCFNYDYASRQRGNREFS